jgi:hypothetical protein
VPGILQQKAGSYGILGVINEQEGPFLDAKTTNSKSTVECFLNPHSPFPHSLKKMENGRKKSPRNHGPLIPYTVYLFVNFNSVVKI